MIRSDVRKLTACREVGALYKRGMAKSRTKGVQKAHAAEPLLALRGRLQPPLFFRALSEISGAGLSADRCENYPLGQPNLAHRFGPIRLICPRVYELSRDYSCLTQGRRMALYYCDGDSRRLTGISDIPRSQSRAVRNRS